MRVRPHSPLKCFLILCYRIHQSMSPVFPPKQSFGAIKTCPKRFTETIVDVEQRFNVACPR
jgi:hypothetical protein